MYQFVPSIKKSISKEARKFTGHLGHNYALSDDRIMMRDAVEDVVTTHDLF